MQADGACGAVAGAAGVECAARFTVHDLSQRLVEVVLEQGLEAAEDEVAAAGGEHDEAEMEWDEVFAERVAFDAGEGGNLADDSVREGVDEA
ncbi:hypothetical protein [Gaiella occulta]|uniref:hypothetical protein n=1 Tax=Gaiella occulta TaxID=1002870 RepID=UPI0011C04B75|nr:hypothetical protein [Gaiella occulta]